MTNPIQKTLLKFKEKMDGQFIIGIDLETGGLNDATHLTDPNIPEGTTGAHFYPILQIAVIVYDNDFNEVGEPLNIIIQHSKDELDETVYHWSKNQFKDTLMLQCPESDITLDMATDMVVEHLNSIGINKDNVGYMFGNSIRLDIEFISAQMKNLKDVMTHRLFDVSTLKTMFNFMFGEYAYFKKQSTHDALNDIRESRAELQYYLDNFIVQKEVVARNLMTTELITKG